MYEVRRLDKGEAVYLCSHLLMTLCGIVEIKTALRCPLGYVHVAQLLSSGAPAIAGSSYPQGHLGDVIGGRDEAVGKR